MVRVMGGLTKRAENGVAPHLTRSLIVRGLALVLALLVATVVLHDVAVWLIAGAAAGLASLDGIRTFAVAATGDEVYARLVLSMVGNIQVRGLALAPPLALALKPIAGGLIANSRYLSTGDWTGVVFTAGSSAVGVQLVQVAVDSGMALAGAVLLVLARRLPASATRTLQVAGALWLAYGAGAELRLSWASGSGGEMALSMVATKVLGLHSSLYDTLLAHGAFASFGINLLLLLPALVIAALATGGATARLISRARPKTQRRTLAKPARAGLSAAMLFTLGYATVSSAVAFEDAPAAVPGGHGPAKLAAALAAWPSVVTIQPRPDGQGWLYLVNGKPTQVHGIGYNAITAGEDPAIRAAQFDRDFTAISAAGANTIVGWSEQEFDDVLMRSAAAHGLGVILPFQLGPAYVNTGPDYAYEDPAVQKQLLDGITARVERYRNSPALRMWGLGNEVLHALAWAKDPPSHSQAFAKFLIQAADRVHELDPNHPVVYRDAEDWYAKYM
ncbi:MAG TPA: glycoside hydrolase family 2 TIM barrel-domain containing protein, partial [Chloroflexota bacterium]|nr:glycoside hydrolase family 2 TIM barrel-domain containing protein [Chloroflexota bacterium]